MSDPDAFLKDCLAEATQIVAEMEAATDDHELDRRGEEHARVLSLIASLQAVTFDGLKAKAEALRQLYPDDDFGEEQICPHDGLPTTDLRLLCGLARDIWAM